MNILDKQGVTYLCNYMDTSEHVIIHARVCVCVCVCVCSLSVPVPPVSVVGYTWVLRCSWHHVH